MQRPDLQSLCHGEGEAEPEVTLAQRELSTRDCHLRPPRLFQEEVRTQQGKTLARASWAFGAKYLRRPKGLFSAIG